MPAPHFFLVMSRHPPTSTLFPYTTLFRSEQGRAGRRLRDVEATRAGRVPVAPAPRRRRRRPMGRRGRDDRRAPRDRKSTRLNSSHLGISYAVFCLKKKKKQ